MRGRSVSWTITTVNPKLQQLAVIAQRRGLVNTGTVYADTITVYLADPKIQ
jgi:hypothetical protein